jgi:hypothetical protein
VVSGVGSIVKVALLAPALMTIEPVPLVKLRLPVVEEPLDWKLEAYSVIEGAVPPSRAAAKFTVSAEVVGPCG